MEVSNSTNESLSFDEAWDKYIQLEQELINSQEYKTLQAIKQLWKSFSIFHSNAAELKRTIKTVDTNEKMQMMWTAPHKELLDSYLFEVSRLLHNFVASATSLRDHSRRLSQPYTRQDRFPDYQRKIEEHFATHPLAKFVLDLRNYIQHREIPVVAGTWTFDASERGKFLHQAHLSSKAFLEWDNLSADAEKFVKAAGEEIDLCSLVEQYELHVRVFYEWLAHRLKEINTKENEIVARKQNELRRIWGFMLPTHLTIALQGEIYSEQSLIQALTVAAVVNVKSLKTIMDQTENYKERANLLIEYLEKGTYAELSDELRTKLIEAFRRASEAPRSTRAP